MNHTSGEILAVTGTLLCLDVPEGIDFGMDTYSWNTGPKFKGVKMIPPGPHFVYHSMGDPHGSAFLPRVGFWIYLIPGQVIVKRWDKAEESFVPDSKMDQDEVERYTQGVRNFDFDQYLGPYPAEICDKWKYLTHYITPEVLEKLEPVDKVISSEGALARETNQQKQKKSRSLSEQAKLRDNLQNIAELMEGVEMDAADEGDFLGNTVLAGETTFYTNIPKQAYPLGSGPQEITKHSIDKSYLLTRLLVKEYKDGESLEALEQWKKMVTLICSCEDALLTHPKFFYDAIAVLHHQLNEVPQDFFQDVLSHTNFLVPAFRSFFELLEGEQLDYELRNRGQQFKALVKKRFGKDFTTPVEEMLEDDDDAPVIVEM